MQLLPVFVCCHFRKRRSSKREIFEVVIHDALSDRAAVARSCFNDEADKMGVSVAEQQESFSDYGSDFTPDEEEILTGLLQRAPLEPDNPITDPDLQLKDIEDEATPKGARVRTLGLEHHALPSPTREKKRATIQVDGNGGNATDSVLCVARFNT